MHRYLIKNNSSSIRWQIIRFTKSKRVTSKKHKLKFTKLTKHKLLIILLQLHSQMWSKMKIMFQMIHFMRSMKLKFLKDQCNKHQLKFMHQLKLRQHKCNNNTLMVKFMHQLNIKKHNQSMRHRKTFIRDR